MRRGLMGLTLALWSCAAPIPAPPEPATVAVPSPVAPAADPAKQPEPPAPVDPVEAYQEQIEAEVAGVRRLRHLETFSGVYEVRTYRGRRRHDGVLHLTLGLGLGQKPPVELLARAHKPSEAVAEVLLAVARQLQAAPTEGGTWKGYQTLQLAQPVRGFQRFDLVPAGDARGPQGSIQLLRVMPLTLDEFEAASSEQGGQWSGAAGADLESKTAALDRWNPAFESGDSPSTNP